MVIELCLHFLQIPRRNTNEEQGSNNVATHLVKDVFKVLGPPDTLKVTMEATLKLKAVCFIPNILSHS